MLILFVLSIVIGVVIAIVTPDGSIIPIIYAVAAGIFSLFMFFTWWGALCKNCGNGYAYEEINREQLPSKEIKRYKYESRYNYRTDMFESYEVPDKPMIEYKYKIRERCKFCGHERTRIVTITRD